MGKYNEKCGKFIYKKVCMSGDTILVCGAVRGVVKATTLIDFDDRVTSCAPEQNIFIISKHTRWVVFRLLRNTDRT